MHQEQESDEEKPKEEAKEVEKSDSHLVEMLLHSEFQLE